MLLLLALNTLPFVIFIYWEYCRATHPPFQPSRTGRLVGEYMRFWLFILFFTKTSCIKRLIALSICKDDLQAPTLNGLTLCWKCKVYSDRLHLLFYLHTKHILISLWGWKWSVSTLQNKVNRTEIIEIHSVWEYVAISYGRCSPVMKVHRFFAWKCLKESHQWRLGAEDSALFAEWKINVLVRLLLEAHTNTGHTIIEAQNSLVWKDHLVSNPCHGLVLWFKPAGG